MVLRAARVAEEIACCLRRAAKHGLVQGPHPVPGLESKSRNSSGSRLWMCWSRGCLHRDLNANANARVRVVKAASANGNVPVDTVGRSKVREEPRRCSSEMHGSWETQKKEVWLIDGYERACVADHHPKRQILTCHRGSLILRECSYETKYRLEW